MAVPPSIPTSFVPRQQISAAGAPHRMDFIGAMGLLAYVVLGIAVLAAIGVFAYGQILDSQIASKNAELETAKASIDSATVESFVRLRDRLSSGHELLTNHVALSAFFDAIGSLTPTTVRFGALSFTLAEDHTAQIQMTGTAKSFNALAALSASLGTESHVRDAIFSNIAVLKDGSVSFALSAKLDRDLVAYTGLATAPSTGSGQVAPVATSSPQTNP